MKAINTPSVTAPAPKQAAEEVEKKEEAKEESNAE